MAYQGSYICKGPRTSNNVTSHFPRKTRQLGKLDALQFHYNSHWMHQKLHISNVSKDLFQCASDLWIKGKFGFQLRKIVEKNALHNYLLLKARALDNAILEF